MDFFGGPLFASHTLEQNSSSTWSELYSLPHSQSLRIVSVTLQSINNSILISLLMNNFFGGVGGTHMACGILVPRPEIQPMPSAES